jgi:hypothetical protein
MWALQIADQPDIHFIACQQGYLDRLAGWH